MADYDAWSVSSLDVGHAHSFGGMSGGWDVLFGASPEAPTPPRAVVGEAGDGEAAVSWQAPAHTGGGPVLTYTVLVSPGDHEVQVAGDTWSVIVEGLDNGTPYTASVVAENVVGASDASSASAPFTPAPPVLPEAPTVEWVSPAPGTPLAPSDAVTVRVLDPDLTVVILSARFTTGAQEVVYRGGAFAAQYAGSTVAELEGGAGLEFVLRRVGGWRASFHVTVDVADAEGLVAP